MKKLIVFFAIAASFHSLANSTNIEFDDAIEEKCHAEIKKLNCTSKTDEETGKEDTMKRTDAEARNETNTMQKQRTKDRRRERNQDKQY